MNKVILSGNLCKDVELRYTPNNVSVLQNTIAVKNDFKNANGEYESQFINFVAYRNNAEFLSKYASKGSKVLLEGKINTRSYDDKDGNKRYITEVIVDKTELLGAKKEENAQNNQNIVQNVETDPFAEFGNTVTIDDNFLD
jgi:single-strand DNA-binding protein